MGLRQGEAGDGLEIRNEKLGIGGSWKVRGRQENGV